MWLVLENFPVHCTLSPFCLTASFLKAEWSHYYKATSKLQVANSIFSQQLFHTLKQEDQINARVTRTNANCRYDDYKGREGKGLFPLLFLYITRWHSGCFLVIEISMEPVLFPVWKTMISLLQCQFLSPVSKTPILKWSRKLIINVLCPYMGA